MGMNIGSLISAVCAVGLCVGALLSCSSENDSEITNKAEVEVAREVSFSVPSVTCAACLATIRKEVIVEPSVVSMGGDPKTKTVVVRLSADAPGDDAFLVEAIKRAGYEATVK